MGDNSSISFWKIAAAVLVTALFIGAVLLIARQGKAAANEKLEGVSRALSDYQDEGYALYDGLEVTGAEAAAAVKRAVDHDDYIAVRVITKMDSGTDYNYKYNNAKTISRPLQGDRVTPDGWKKEPPAVKSDGAYINPSAVFTGKIIRDDNGTLIAVIFTQK